RDRRILAVYATALLLAFALIAVRLRRSFSELDQMNAELQRANTSLEQQVEERTQDLKKALEDLRMQQAQLIQSEKMASLGQMVAGVAHEINTPLGYARANVETVRETLPALGAADPESVGELDMLLEDAQHGLTQIGELVMSLKDFSCLDRSHTELLDVHDGLETALKICHNQLKARIEIEREYGELPRIHGAPSQLNQVFLNLLTNAAQAIDGPGTIRIRTRREGDQVEIGIRDSGCGIDAETQAHIFEPFFTTKPVGQGTGLGLSIVYRIIEDHRGTIRCESAPGEGAEFIITLPIRRAARPEAENSDEPVAVAAGSV
ncbi:MAG: sensor histidine kinase, partial [Gammaproteobacteria bacterium]